MLPKRKIYLTKPCIIGLNKQRANWKEACLQGAQTASEHQKQKQLESKKDKKRIRELEKELTRKEKALAETAALLVLRKKLNAL